MRLIIAGGRDYELSGDDYECLNRLHRDFGVSLVISGACRGADKCGETWAEVRDIPVRRYRAYWNTHGRAAGPIRNELMAKNADAIAVFPGGRGTADMVRTAERHGLTIYDFREQAEAKDIPLA